MTGFFADEDLKPNRIELARKDAEARAGYIDLTSSNPTHQGFIFPPEILRRAAEPYWTERRYDPDPRGLKSARDAIVRYYATRTPPLKLDPDDVFITASTSEAYALLFALLGDPGDNVLASAITYPLFEYLAEYRQLSLNPYELDSFNNWKINENDLLASADDESRAVLIVSPHNPTGMIVKERIAALDKLGLPVICDEVFCEFLYAAKSTPPFGTLYADLPVFHLNGISKMFALPDLKLGWIALNAPAREKYGERLALLNDTFLGSNYLVQSMLPALFKDGRSFLETMKARIRSNIDAALALLSKSPRFSVCLPDGGYYLFPEVSDWDDEEELVLHLLKHGVLVHPGYFYGNDDGTRIMISCLTESEKLMEGLKILVEKV